jgi:hypothetical protein
MCINRLRGASRRRLPQIYGRGFQDRIPQVPEFPVAVLPRSSERDGNAYAVFYHGIAVGKPFEFDKLPEAQKADMSLALKDGYEAIEKQRDDIGKNVNSWLVGAALGDRGFFHGNFLLRAAAAHGGHLR